MKPSLLLTAAFTPVNFAALSDTIPTLPSELRIGLPSPGMPEYLFAEGL